MPKPRKTARQKLETVHDSHGRIVAVPHAWRARMGVDRMLIPRPLDLEAAMRTVRKGKTLRLADLRAALGKAAGVETSCPLVTGIFVRLVAEAAEEDRAAGKPRITPYWRTVRDDGSMNEKYPGGVEAQAKRLRDEGVELVMKRGKTKVAV